MTPNNDIAIPQAPTNVPFNLIIAPSLELVRKIAKHYDLSDVRNVDELHLPAGGAKRGDALNELLGKTENTVTLAVVIDGPWIGQLLANTAMSASVWRSIESKLVGHRTGSQRHLIVVADAFTTNVRDAQAANLVQSIVSGQSLPNNWKPPMVKPEAKKTEKVIKAQTKSAKGPQVEGRGNREKPEGQKVKAANTHGQSGKKSDRPVIDRSKKTKAPRAVGSNQSLHDDLYLLSKAHYGLCNGPVFLEKAQKVIAHHTGMAGGIPVDLVVTHLFRTLIAKSSRGYWGGFNLLQSVVEAGGQNPGEVVNTLNGWIGAIPARDAQGQEIPQPKANPQLFSLREGGVAANAA